MYRTSDQYVLCGLCEQEERERLLRELQTMAARACELEVLLQQLKKQMRDHQVSRSGFNAVEDRTFYFYFT
jgi:hypothetical protein